MSKLKRKTAYPYTYMERTEKITKNDQIYRKNILYKNHRSFELKEIQILKNIQKYLI